MKTLADFKRALSVDGVKLTLIDCILTRTGEPEPHFALDTPRRVSKLQTKSFALMSPESKESWVEFGKAGDWSFSEDLVTHHSDWLTLTYRVTTH
jgi:hypothetical protein